MTYVKLIGMKYRLETFLFFRLILSSFPTLLCRLSHTDHQEDGGQDSSGAPLSHPVLRLQAFSKDCEVVQGPHTHRALREVQNQAGAAFGRTQDFEGEA